MIGKPVALIQVPNRRLFDVAATDQHVGKVNHTIRKLAHLNIIKSITALNTASRTLSRWRT